MSPPGRPKGEYRSAQREGTLVCAAPAAGRVSGNPLVEIEDDLEAINAAYRAKSWSDGLPIVPPTRERVARMLAAVDVAPDTVVARLAPGFGVATVERIAINAVMAGCGPIHLPLLVAAVEAVATPAFNLQAIQATTNPVAVFVIVNGPAARELGFNGTFNCLGEGNWSNATVGRALRLVLRNIGGALPGQLDRATQGQPGKYSFCCAENEADSPWAAAARGARFRAGAKHGDGRGHRRHDEHEHAQQGGAGTAARDRRDDGASAEQRILRRRRSRGSSSGRSTRTSCSAADAARSRSSRGSGN